MNFTRFTNNINVRFTPICCRYIVYRMLHNDPDVELDMKSLQKFGVNESW